MNEHEANAPDETTKFRQRAEAAETILADLQNDLEARIATIDEQRARIDSLTRARELDERLIEAGAVDLETARLLAQRAIDESEDDDPEAAIEAIRARKPFLFRTHFRGSGVLGPRPRNEQERAQIDQVERAAADAAESGRRQDLLRYLRLRRRG